jgi:hypothetical protein
MSLSEPHAAADEPTADLSASPDHAVTNPVEHDEFAGLPSAEGPTPPAAGFLPTSPTRLGVESVFVRLIATTGVVGVGTALGWIVGIAVSMVSVILAALLWRSRRL